MPPQKRTQAPAPVAPPLANSTATPDTQQAPVTPPADPLGVTTANQPATPRTLADEVANPAGPPEGTDHGHAGDGPEPTPPVVEVAPTDTPVAQQPEEPPVAPGSPTARLVTYLRTHYPDEVGRTTPSGPEHPADTAVRVLTRLGAVGLTTARCPEAYCNYPAGHEGVHGWVHA